MKKTYIQPDMLMVRLNVANSILTVSNPGAETTGITLSGDENVDDPTAVWTKGSKGIWSNEW